MNERTSENISWKSPHSVTLLRNLNLGAKAETASGKRVTHLEEKTKVELVKLLQGNVSTV